MQPTHVDSAPKTVQIQYPLTRRDVLILKGIGIFLIAFHNYFHWLPGMGIENEFHFKASGFTHYVEQAFSSIYGFIIASFAYFGHFGVQLFVLVSGYGLYASARRQQATVPDQLIRRLIRIFTLLVIGATVVCVVRVLATGEPFNTGILLEIVIFRMTSIWNFSYDTLFKYSGPFWYFGLTVQLYLIYPLLDKLMRETSPGSDLVRLITVSALNIVLQPLLGHHNVPLMGLFIGQLPTFMVGVLLAKHGPCIHPIGWLACIALFVLGQFHSGFFVTTGVTAAWLMTAAYLQLKKWSIPFTHRMVTAAAKLGSISMAIFVLNGPLRTLPLFRDEAGNLLADQVLLFMTILVLISIPLSLLHAKTSTALIALWLRYRH